MRYINRRFTYLQPCLVRPNIHRCTAVATLLSMSRCHRFFTFLNHLPVFRTLSPSPVKQPSYHFRCSISTALFFSFPVYTLVVFSGRRQVINNVQKLFRNCVFWASRDAHNVVTIAASKTRHKRHATKLLLWPAGTCVYESHSRWIVLPY